MLILNLMSAFYTAYHLFMQTVVFDLQLYKTDRILKNLKTLAFLLDKYTVNINIIVS